MQDLPTTLAVRRPIHPNDTRDGESSGASYLKPSRNPFKLDVHYTKGKRATLCSVSSPYLTVEKERVTCTKCLNLL